MANANINFGFAIWNELLRARLYAVQTNPTINIMTQDMVQEDVFGIASPKLGYASIVQDGQVITAANGPGLDFLMLGSVLECFDEKMDPVAYIAAARTGDGIVAGYVLVSDHPYQQYVANVDGVLVLNSSELNYDVGVTASTNLGWTDTGLSKQRISATSPDVYVYKPLRLYGQAYPDDVYSAAGCRMICQINPLCHKYGAGVTI